AREAAAWGAVLRPPVELTAGWQAILGWLLGIVGFAAAWVAIVIKKPSFGLLLPLPVAAIAGISVPDSHQVASGLVVLVLFAVGLGMLSGTQMGAGDDKLPAGYEIRRALRALPLLAVVTGGLFLLAQTDFLFPKPAINPAEQPQKPKTVPLSQVEDRVLFSVDSALSGPWRVGSLDVYDGKDWRLPAFSEPAVADLLDKAPKSSKWDEFDFLRTYVLSNVTATGTGSPKSIPPERVQDMLAGSKEGTPYEIVAVQALLARWAGIPSRIGYGFDGGEVTDNKLEVRPKNGAAFPEVYFPKYGWLPVIGTPTKAKPTVGSDPATQRQEPNVLLSVDLPIG